MSMSKQGNVALIIYQYRGVTMDAFGSVKELIQHYIAQTSLEGSWGSQEQLDSLREIKALLDRTIDNVAVEVAADIIRNG